MAGNGRDGRGRFVKGHKLSNGNNGGRPPRALEDKYLKAMSSRVSLQDWKDITDRAVDDARNGDAKARQWLSDYLMGKPPQSVDVTSKGDKIESLTSIVVREYLDDQGD